MDEITSPVILFKITKKPFLVTKKIFSPSKIYSYKTSLLLNYHFRGVMKINFIYKNYLELLELIPDNYSKQSYEFILDFGSHIGAFIIPFPKFKLINFNE